MDWAFFSVCMCERRLRTGNCLFCLCRVICKISVSDSLFPYGKKFIYQVATYMYLPTYLPTVTECIE